MTTRADGMTVAELIETLRDWEPTRRVLVVTTEESEGGEIPPGGAPVLTVGSGPDPDLLLLVV